MELPRRTGPRKPGRRPGRAHASTEATPANERWIALGVVMGTHGVRGELRVKLHNPESELLFELAAVQLRVGKELRPYRVQDVRPGGKGVLVRLESIDTVERAQALRGTELCVARSQLPALPDGEFYHCDLEGLKLVDTSGTTQGTIERVQEYPAASVLRVRTERGMLEVPMREPYVVRIDLEAGYVVADRLNDLEPERV
jgi:16S rRNA processing protein RimM